MPPTSGTDHGSTPPPDPLAVILYRLAAIERRMDSLMTVELYTARDEALRRRMEALEAAQDESNRALRQVIIGVVTTVAGAAVAAGVVVL